jgi:lambda repressor-like predicted transcriptional regulator
MTPFDIKVALMKEGVSMRSIAKKLGVSANSVSLVVNRRMVSRRIMEEVARSIGSTPSKVFPELHFECKTT